MQGGKLMDMKIKLGLAFAAGAVAATMALGFYELSPNGPGATRLRLNRLTGNVDLCMVRQGTYGCAAQVTEKPAD